MKKIFAIALALVMVFSMASAFALSACDTRAFAWGCLVEDTYCGKAVIEVVPFAHVNDACDKDAYVANECAAAILDENVYFGFKLTVDAYPDAEWFASAYIDVKAAGIDNVEKKYDKVADFDWDGVVMTEDEAVTYWYCQTAGKWVAEEDVEFDRNGAVFSAVVTKAADAEVCAKLVAFYNGYDFVNTVGDYEVAFAVASGTDYVPATKDAFVGGEFNGVMIVGKDNDVVIYEVVAGEIMEVLQSTKGFAAEVASVLNLGCGLDVCVNDDNILANFGWDEEQEDCNPWSSKGAAVVDPECVVAIPKTGDVSVVAYAVMAVVAAAGAMLKK